MRRLLGSALGAQYLRQDTAKAIALATISVSALAGLSWCAQKVELLCYPYLSPFVALVAVLAVKVGLRAGLSAVVASIVIYEALLSPFPGIPVAEFSTYVSMLAVAVWISPDVKKSPSDNPRPADGPLPFTRMRGQDEGANTLGLKRDFWDVTANGQWSEDCAVGAEYARIYMERMSRNREAPPLSWIVASMLEKQRFTGVETGFLSTIDRAMRTGTVKPAE